MSFLARSLPLLAAVTLASLAACGGTVGSGDDSSGGGGDGSTGSGNPSPGSGATTGGNPTGGNPTGGNPTGGSPTGGDPTGGSPTGGSPAGGSGGANPGTGGSDSTSVTVTSSGSTSSGGTGSGECSIFCSDFEDGALPSELSFFPEYLRDRASNFVSLDNTGHSGSRSVKVTSSEFSQMLAVPVPSKFWGRVYIKSDTAIQSGHNTYIAVTDGNGDPNNNEHIRIGEHQCQLEVNRKSDDAEKLSGGMYSCDVGVKFTPNTWYCLEFYFDGPGSEVRVFVDDKEIDNLHVTNWGPYEYKMFKFGFERYHGGDKTLWYDDLALSAERVGCGQ